MQQHAARKHREHDVWRLRFAVGIRHHARLDGVEGVAALGIGADAAKPFERGVGQRALVLRIGEAALAVGLPDLQHAVDDRRAVAVIHDALDADALARGVGRDEIAGEGVVLVILSVRRLPVGLPESPVVFIVPIILDAVFPPHGVFHFVRQRVASTTSLPN